MAATPRKADAPEQRATANPVEIRLAGADTGVRTATGYAVLFNVEANIYDLWVEKVLPGAFDVSLKERDVLALRSHDSSRIVGRLKAGTLTLKSDSKGLSFENPLPDTTDGRDLAVQIERGDVAGMSFGFRATKQIWDDYARPPTRTIVEAELYEITYTPMPAYDSTEVGLRSLAQARDERRDHNKSGALSRITARRARQAQAERGL